MFAVRASDAESVLAFFLSPDPGVLAAGGRWLLAVLVVFRRGTVARTH